MFRQSFAGSAGLLDIPAPDWLASDEGLFGYWGMCLMTLIRHGKIDTVKRGETLSIFPAQLCLLIEGGLYALDEGTQENRCLFVSFLRRGDLFKPIDGLASPITYVAHTRSSVLILDDASLNAFTNEFALSSRLLHSLELFQAQRYAGAAQTVGWKDRARVLRAMQMLAEHPTATDTRLGREIESSKNNIRRLAGVQKRSATRTFSALAESGVVTWHGYKRLFFKGDTNGTTT